MWERLVQSCKKALKVVLHGQVVTDVFLETAFAQTVALVNSKPLTEVSSCSCELEAITPSHFLISCANPVLSCGVFADKEFTSKKRWRQTQVIINQVWVRWLRKYLPTQIARKNQSTCNVKVRDLVVDEKTQKGDWPLAHVIKISRGKHEIVRVCEVNIITGVYKKPVAKLALLEECPT